MTVKELKDALESFDDEMEVGFAYNYGDHWGTQVVEQVTETDVRMTTYSDYHSMRKLTGETREDDETCEMLVLS